MKHHKIDIQFHMGTNRKENADEFIEAYLALIEEELSGGAFTKKEQCLILEEMIAICKNSGEKA